MHELLSWIALISLIGFIVFAILGVITLSSKFKWDISDHCAYLGFACLVIFAICITIGLFFF